MEDIYHIGIEFSESGIWNRYKEQWPLGAMKCLRSLEMKGIYVFIDYYLKFYNQ